MTKNSVQKPGYLPTSEQSQAASQGMQVTPKAIISETGDLYLLKKPLYKQALFWTSLVFGAAACFFFMATMAFLDENNAIHRALAYYGMYYDHETLDIYSEEELEVLQDILPIFDRLSPAAQALSDKAFEDPNKLSLADIENLMAEVKPAAKDYVTELEGHVDESSANGDLLPDEEISLRESIETYRGWINLAVEDVVTAYQTKETEKRSFSEEEKTTLLETLLALIVPEELTPETPDLGDKGTSI